MTQKKNKTKQTETQVLGKHRGKTNCTSMTWEIYRGYTCSMKVHRGKY